MQSLNNTIAFDIQGYEIPESQIEPLVPLKAKLDLATEALDPVNNRAGKDSQSRLNNAEPSTKKYRDIHAANVPKDVLKDAHREQRRAIKADIKAINAEAVPFVREILKGMRTPVAEFYDMHRESEERFAETIGVKFEPSTTLQAVAQALAWLDRLIAGEPTIATLTGIVEI